MPLKLCHAGDFRLDENRYFAEAAHCLSATATANQLGLFQSEG
jgi:hypothetical protein